MSRLRGLLTGLAGLGMIAGLVYASKKRNKIRRVPVEYVKDSSVVLISYEDLVKGSDLTESITAAFGPNGLGILAVSGIPNFSQLRQDLLPLAHKFANLPESTKEKYVNEPSSYQFGWSHGKEKFAGQPDLLKGSYYNNPIYDKPFDDQKVIDKWPTFASPNIWPKEDLPGLEPAFKRLGKMCVEVGLLLAKHCDRYAHSKCSSYNPTRLYDVIRTSRVIKARLLHYFPGKPEHKRAYKSFEEEVDSWCGWHNDHGSLTALVPSMYIDAKSNIVPCPDAKAGLYIKNRAGEIVKGAFPADCLAFQMGETHQIHSGGILQATPHCVMSSDGTGKSAGVSRETFAVFMEPGWEEPMNVPLGIDPNRALIGSSEKFLPRGIPPLEQRWKKTMSFGEFTVSSLNAYTVRDQQLIATS